MRAQSAPSVPTGIGRHGKTVISPCHLDIGIGTLAVGAMGPGGSGQGASAQDPQQATPQAWADGALTSFLSNRGDHGD